METEKRTAEEIYSNVVGRPGTHKDLPLHINATGEYLRKDLVFTAIHKYAAQELADYKARLKVKIATEYSILRLNNILEIIDKL